MIMKIRKAAPSDFEGIWSVFQAVVAQGNSYVFSPATPREDAFAYWFGEGVISFVAEADSCIIGMYKLIPNQRDLGSHVANASFMVSDAARGKGVGRAMGEHCLNHARLSGYSAIQFNFVVSTNKPAIRLWKSLGFSIVGTLPKVFRHQRLGYVDAYVMHRFLDDINPDSDPLPA